MLGVFLFWVGCPLSHGWRRASVSAAASVGAGAQWAPFSAWSPLPRRSVMGAAHWAASPEPAGESAPLWGAERARCQRPPRMGCVEALAGCPLSRLTATAPPKGEPSLASPLGGRWCPVGTVQRLTEPAGESGLALARTERARCQRPPRMGRVEALAGCPLSHGCAVPALPKGEPSLASPLGGGGLALARTERAHR